MSEVLLESPGATWTQVVDGEKVTLLCSGVNAPSKEGLRCRFGGNVEVPARLESQTGIISCCAPSQQEVDLSTEGETQALRVPVQVLSDQKCLAQDVLDYSALVRAREDSAKQAADADKAKGATAEPERAEALPSELEPAAAGGDGAAQQGVDPAVKETRREYLRREYSALKPFVIISLSYLLFTTTDGAVRMIVLLHAYQMGFSAWEVAIMFTMYELAGVVTNLLAGVMGAKWGIKWTLLSGLCLQLVGISVLYAWQSDWNKWQAVLFVTCAQLLCGIAKDLTKLGGKTVTKLVTSDEQQTRLFKLVSFITGMKNSLKGIGYFIGSVAVAFNYYFALGLLLFLIVLAIPWAALGLSRQLGRARKENLTLARIFKQKYNVNVLSMSRMFLFGSRDMWFEVPLPFFLRNAQYGLGWSRPATGAFLAAWIIVYGQMQSWTPQLVLGPLKQSPANKYGAVLWNALLVITPLFMGIMLDGTDIFTSHNMPGMVGVMVSGLYVFCLIFAVNSSIHSYLIVKYADGDKVAMNIGIYYMCNAVGRLTGTLVSGALYSYVGDTVIQGFAACFWASLGFAITSAVIEVFLKDNSGGLQLGSRITLVKPPATAEAAPKVEVEMD